MREAAISTSDSSGLFGDHHRRGQRERDVLVAAAEPLVGPFEGVGHEIEVGDVAVGDDVADQRLDGVALEAIGALARFDELDQLDGGRTDVDADQRRILRLERVQDGIEFICEHGSLGASATANADNLH